MQAFAQLFEQIDQTTSTNEKVDRLAEFFRRQDADTCAWALFFLAGRKPKQLVGSAKLRKWAQESIGFSDWLMAECYAAVGDTAEMIALLFATADPKGSSNSTSAFSLGEWMNHRLLPLARAEDDERRSQITAWWKDLRPQEIFILNKLLTGSLRVEVSETLVYRALASALSLPIAVVASRLVGSWHPTAEFFTQLRLPADNGSTGISTGALLPQPFCLAAPLDKTPTELGRINDWQCEWKWDGIRCQAVKQGAQIEIWSRGEERITGSFPDLVAVLADVPGDWILDGEIVAGEWHEPRSFQTLQIRLNRKKVSDTLTAAVPVSFLAYDLLHWNGVSWRHRMLTERRSALEALFHHSLGPHVGLSPILAISSWNEAAILRQQSRSHGAEGLIIKGKRTPYEVGRKRGIWFKWKIDPFTVDAVLTAAQPGTGRRASLYTDYTFSIWKDEALIPIAKAYSGLTDAEIRELDGWIRKHTTERFGPVRMVEGLRLFEIGFEGISRSERHKSGFAVRFPRIIRERTDKRVQEANRLEDLEGLLEFWDRHSKPLAGRIEPTPSVTPTPPSKQMSLDFSDEVDSL